MPGAEPAEYDVIIVGSGPAGVSAAFPLVSSGCRVLMVDGGLSTKVKRPDFDYKQARLTDPKQFDWMIGDDYYALRQDYSTSPKLRVPTSAGIFAEFSEANRVVANEFLAVGSLAVGGLSNAWGCGVAALTGSELTPFPTTPSAMTEAYGRVATRIGISGRCDDDLADFFGLDQWAQEPLPLDELQEKLFRRYNRSRKILLGKGFRLGRSRVAVLSRPLSDRKACDQGGGCLWGCPRGATYSANVDLVSLRKHANFSYKPGFIVNQVRSAKNLVYIYGRDGKSFAAHRAFLAAGTLASTRLALEAIEYDRPVRMESCPTAAFMLWQPDCLKQNNESGFGLGQLSFSLGINRTVGGFGSLFSTAGIPVSEFARHVPFGKPNAVSFLLPFLRSCVVANLFLPGSLTDASLQLNDKRELVVRGAYKSEAEEYVYRAKKILRSSFFKLGAFMVPASFRLGMPGSDIHYAASLPMKEHPVLGETDRYGELVGARGIHLIDGSSLPYLPEKSHTLTIMANADRIGRYISTLRGA